MNFFSILLVTFGMATVCTALSVQGDEEAKIGNIFADQEVTSSLTDRRNQMREMRLMFLGALTEQLVKWFFNDVIPKEVMHRTKRSLDIPG